MKIFILIIFFIRKIVSIKDFYESFGHSNENIDNIINISFEDKKGIEFNINPRIPYIFSIENKNYRIHSPLI